MADYSKAIQNLRTFIRSVDTLCNKAVYVGVPQANTSREDDEVTNAELMYIHTNGSPMMNIPARPVIEPAIEANREQINKKLDKAFNAYKKSESEGDKELEKVGIFASDRCRRWFTDPRNGWAPNAPITIHGGWMKNPSTWQMVHVKGKGKKKNRPLIDTGALRRSITYVIDKG